jgi:glutamate 5-kinase
MYWKIDSQFVNTTEALNELINQDIIPVINENDIVATEELKFGDNDRLSAIVAIITKADRLIIITDQEGLFNSDPAFSNEARKIDYIEYDSEELTNLIDKSSSGGGMGGFSTKIMAAQMAGFSGIPTQIISWNNDVLVEVLNEKKIGTFIKPSIKKVKLKKLWIAYGLQVTGKIIIDDGAVDAINSDASLLSIGIKQILNDFDVDEGVEIFDERDKIVAKGLSKLSSREISKESNEIVIHKDNLLIL